MLIAIISLLSITVVLNIWLRGTLLKLRSKCAAAGKELNHLRFKVVKLQEECKTWKDAAQRGSGKSDWSEL